MRCRVLFRRVVSDALLPSLRPATDADKGVAGTKSLSISSGGGALRGVAGLVHEAGASECGKGSEVTGTAALLSLPLPASPWQLVASLVAPADTDGFSAGMTGVCEAGEVGIPFNK